MFKRFRQQRLTRLELERLSDRDLSDIGINRCDIPRIVKEIMDE